MSIMGGVNVEMKVTLINRDNKEVLMPEVTFNEFVRPEQHMYHNQFVLETMAEALAKITVYRKLITAIKSNPLYHNALSEKNWTIKTEIVNYEIIF